MLFAGAAVAQVTKIEVAPERPASNEVVASLYDKSLTSLGAITAVHIEEPKVPNRHTDESSISASQAPVHSAVWPLIEHARLQDWHSTSVALGLPPRFSIEYSSGLRVQADKYSARVTFPDGTTASYVLLP